ncbi:hypothetical protein EIK56_25230 [Sphingomonas sp. C8-2]|nr:hypothetical protein EIK56_25230 [Sphingomonas sp. C8-2]
MSDPKNQPAGDLNYLLAHEQKSIMRAEAATQPDVRDSEREAARGARRAIDLTAFPTRDPHDFDAITPAQQRAIDLDSEFEALQRQVVETDRLLAVDFSEGTVGEYYNTFQHRSRLVRQARARLNEVRNRQSSAPSIVLEMKDRQ